MDPTLLELRRALAQFLDREIASAAASGDREGVISSCHVKRLGELGYFDTDCYGAVGFGLLAESIVVAEVARVWGALAVSVAASLLAARAAKELREAGISALSDVRSGDATVAIGRLFYPFGEQLAFGPPHADFALVLPDMRCEGSTAGWIARPSSIDTIEYEGFRGLCAATLTARPDHSLDPVYSQLLLTADRIFLSAIAAGLAQGALDRAVAYAKERIQFGHPIGVYGEIQSLLVKASSKSMAARHVLLLAAQLFDEGECTLALATRTYLSATDAAVWVSERAQHVHGGYGQMAEYQIGRYVRDARTLSALAAPHSEIIRFLAQDLGLPQMQGSSSRAREKHEPNRETVMSNRE